MKTYPLATFQMFTNGLKGANLLDNPRLEPLRSQVHFLTLALVW